MTTAHAIALGLLIAIGALSVFGVIQMFLRPFNIAAKAIYGVADALVYARQMERACRMQIEADRRRIEAKLACGRIRDALGKVKEAN